ncbi:3-hydroxyacyl-CoA dehydrogenase family protein [Chloroflexota bacterium]
MQINKVGVVGCGLMGSGIAQVCAQSGYQTVVSEINDELLNRGLDMMKTQLSKAVEKGKMTKDEEGAVLGRIKGTTNVQEFSDCDLVIEVIIENMEEKKKLFATLDGICQQNAILASNTSCLSIIEMAMATKRPDRVIGLHFFNPVPVYELAELVRTIASSEETVQAVKNFGESIGKKIILAQDTPAFIVNRLLVPYLLDAIRVLESGTASKEDIDNGIVLGLRHPMGPLTLLDFVGLDTIYFIANAMYDEVKDPRFAPPVLLKKLVTAGRYGRKRGEGFYSYK